MDNDSESYYEESSETEEEVAGPLQIHPGLAESPESPPPGGPSPVPRQPIPVEGPLPGWELPDDGNNFLSCFTRTDVLELKKWALETRSRPKEEGYVVEAPVITQYFVSFLQENHGQYWEVKFLRPPAEPLFEQMMAYVVRYARLTSHNKQFIAGCLKRGPWRREQESCGCWRSWAASSKYSKPSDVCRPSRAF